MVVFAKGDSQHRCRLSYAHLPKDPKGHIGSREQSTPAFPWPLPFARDAVGCGAEMLHSLCLSLHNGNSQLAISSGFIAPLC